MKTISTSLLFLLFNHFAISQHLVNATLISTKNTSTIQAYLNAYGWNYSTMDLHEVSSYKITYNTTDVHGNNTIASGAVFIPNLPNCDYVPIIAYEHGTEFKKANVPSNNKYVGQGLYFATTGYITVLPDYLGLGDNPGVHLYQHAETEATATLDLIRAVREYLGNNSALKDNGQIFITGYSQGGHAAMATNKYVEENSLQNEFNVVALSALSGAYDQSGAQFDLIFDGDSNYYASVFLPYILASYQEAYGDLYQNYNEIYDAPYDTLIRDYLQAGTHSFSDWMTMLGTNYYTFMQDSVLQNILADTERNSHPINIALSKNNLYNWFPQNTVKMIYCGNDSMVSPINAINTLDSMSAHGVTNIEAINALPNGDHNTCFIPATTMALALFDSLATKCSYSSLSEPNKHSHIRSYPTICQNYFMLDGIENYDELSYQIISILGNIVQDKNILKQQNDINNLAKGTYLLVIKNNKNNSVVYQSKIIKN